MPAALVYAVVLWWLSTGVILFLNHLPERTFRRSLAAAGLVLIAALAGLFVTARIPGIRAAYLGFTCALLAWGFQEMSFFMGLITGPRRVADRTATGWRRMWHATETLLYHELAIALVGVAIVLLSAGAPNHTGSWTYLALWAMRISAKLNVYLGVRNLNENWVPRRLAYLRHYMTRRPINPLLPVSVLAGAATTCFAFSRALAATGFAQAQWALLGAILSLGVLEHLAMVVPLPFAGLWKSFSKACPVGQDLAVVAVPVPVCPHTLPRS